MWFLHRALLSKAQSYLKVVFHLVRASVHWYEILDIKTIDLMFLGINMFWARLRLKPLGDGQNEL